MSEIYNVSIKPSGGSYMKKSILCKCLLLLTSATLATPFSGCRGDQNNNSQPAATSRYTDVLSMKLSGFVGDRISGNNTNYLNRMVYANSSMFETFFQRNAAQEWSTSAWNGEFPGKILQSIARCYRMSGETQQEELKKTGNYIVSNLKKAQASDGYLGIASDEKKYVGRMSSNGDGYWDLWAQYHCIYGLLLWYEETGNADALEIAVKAGDAMYGFFIEQGHSLSELDAKIPDFSAIRAFKYLYMV